MKTPFTLAGLLLQTPTIKKYAELSSLLIPHQIENRRAELAAWLAELEATGQLLPGGAAAGLAAFEKTAEQDAVGEVAEQAQALTAAQKYDAELIQKAHFEHLLTNRPGLTETFFGITALQAEMNAAGIIEASPGTASIGSAIVASSPAPAATPVPTPPAAPPAPVASANPTQGAPAPTLAPAAGRSPRLTDALTSRFTLPRLTEWLAEVGLVNLETSTAKPGAKPREWAAAREALYNAGLLGELSSEQAATVFVEAFGARVSAGTMKSRADEANKNGKFYYAFLRYKGLLAEFLAR